MKTKLTKAYVDSAEFLAEITKVPRIIKRYLTNGQYLTTHHPKHAVFLHHTAGTTAQGAWSWWNQTPERIGTAYLIDRNGDIYECFDPRTWAFHLGVKGDDDSQEKNSIGIEIVSAGRLLGDKNDTFFPLWPNRAGSRVMKAEEICRLNFRQNKAYHAYTDEQVIALCQLLGKLKVDFPGIPFPKDFTEKAFEVNRDIINRDLKGVFPHSAVRADKDDIFPQPSLLLALTKLFSGTKK
jgi:N-acetyl-anhydromuramyl-L-alanine amidase AmpD